MVSNWNSLPDNVITSNSVGIFENRLDKFCRDEACNFDANIEAINLFSLILVSFRSFRR